MNDLTAQSDYALITGASAGLGAEFARQLAAAGHNLILVARREDRLSALADEMRAAHKIDCQIIVADLTIDLMRRAQFVSERAEPTLSPGHQNEIVPGCGQLPGKLGAQPGRGAGDQGIVTVCCHVVHRC